jgi:glycine reductase
MGDPLRIVHYLNQFFGQIGGEDKADSGISAVSGPVGPGRVLNAAFDGAGVVVGTVIAGDNFISGEGRAAEAAKTAAVFAPDLLIAGPAFAAGRYGLACGSVCAAAGERLGIPTLAAMHEDNPGVALYRRKVIIVPTGANAAGMRAAIADIVPVALALAGKEPLPEGKYFTQGIRKLVLRDLRGARRAVDMLTARLSGAANMTELPLPRFEKVEPAPPLEDIASSTIVLVTEGGLTPKGNPDRIEMSMATKFGIYSIAGLERFDAALFEVAHGGYDNSAARRDPNRLLPLDALRALEREGKLHLGDVIYTTAGNATSVELAAGFGRAMATDIRARFGSRVGALLTAT